MVAAQKGAAHEVGVTLGSLLEQLVLLAGGLPREASHRDHADEQQYQREDANVAESEAPSYAFEHCFPYGRGSKV